MASLIILDDWKVDSLGAVATFLDGKRKPIKKSDRKDIQGPYPYYGASGVIDYVHDYIFDEDLILLGEDGANIITRTYPLAFKITGKVWVNNHAHVIRPKNGHDIDYLTYYLESLSYEKFNTGTAQPKLNLDTCKKIKVLLPPKDEQRKIGKIFTMWDLGIERLEKLIDAKRKLKKCLTQQLLTGKKRFKEFKGQEWKEVRLGDFLIPTIREIQKPSEQYLSLGLRSHGKGVFHKPDFDPNKIAMEKLYEVQENDLIVNITFAWEGAIAIVGANDVGGLVSHRFPTYVFNEEIVLSEFMRHVIRQKYLVFQLGLVSPGGAGRNRVLKKTDFLKITMPIPNVAEQQKIASVLNAADREIQLLCDKLKAMKNQKKGLMQKLLTGKIRVKV